MKFDAVTDVDVLALETDEDLTCLVTLTAPEPSDLSARPGETLVAVLDNSGSMEGEPLDAAKKALHALVDRLKPQDTFGVVTFSSSARVAVPTRPMADHHAGTVHALIDGIEAETATDLSAGYLLGIAESGRHVSPTGASIMLLSDGHANEGITDATRLGGLAARARSAGTTTITIGLGDGYDEVLLAEIAGRGQGSHRFAFTPDDAVQVVAEEAGDLLAKAIVNAFVRIRPTDPALIDRIGLLHDVPRWVEDGASGPCVAVPMGDLYSGEVRELLVKFAVPGIATMGRHVLAEIVVDYVALPALESKTITWPLAVGVGSVADAAGRSVNPSVTTAILLAEVTEAKREASSALSAGDAARAKRVISRQASSVRRAARDLPASQGELRARLHEEEAQLRKLAVAAEERSAAQSLKSLTEDLSMNLRGRGDAERRARARRYRDF